MLAPTTTKSQVCLTLLLKFPRPRGVAPSTSSKVRASGSCGVRGASFMLAPLIRMRWPGRRTLERLMSILRTPRTRRQGCERFVCVDWRGRGCFEDMPGTFRAGLCVFDAGVRYRGRPPPVAKATLCQNIDSAPLRKHFCPLLNRRPPPCTLSAASRVPVSVPVCVCLKVRATSYAAYAFICGCRTSGIGRTPFPLF